MKPVVVVLAAPSGSGKTTIARALVARWPERYGFSVSATTRRPRPGEREGDAYFFLSKEEFRRRVAAGDFLEWAEYTGELYGTLTREVERVLEAGQHVLLDIEVQGARQVRAKYPPPASWALFILPPSAAELLRRLEERRTESSDALKRRLRTAVSELEQTSGFDQVIVNDALDATVATVDRMVTAPQAGRNAGQSDLIKRLIVELQRKIKELA